MGNKINNMIMENERGQNTHSKGEQVKIPLLPYNVDKKSVNDSVPTVGSRHMGNNSLPDWQSARAESAQRRPFFLVARHSERCPHSQPTRPRPNASTFSFKRWSLVYLQQKMSFIIREMVRVLNKLYQDNLWNMFLIIPVLRTTIRTGRIWIIGIQCKFIASDNIS